MPNSQKLPKAEERKMDCELTSVSHGSHDDSHDSHDSHDSLARTLCQDPAMQCFNYEIRIPAKQGFASSNIERLLSLPYEFWMKKQTSLESNQIESY